MGENRLLSVPERMRGQRVYPDEKNPLSVPTLDGGMNTKADPADLQNNEFTVVQNAYIRNNRLIRRNGTEVFTPAKPNSEAVRKMYTAKLYDADIVQLRFSDTKIYRRGSSSWTEIAAAGAAITVPANNVIMADNRVFFSNNGSKAIQEIDLGANDYDDLGNAPRYKYITSFFNRIVGANLIDGGGNIPIQVGWSGDFAFDEWDTTVDPSAGDAPLEESQSDYADEITGIFGFASQMIILRSQSIWLANKLQGTNPFFFYTAIPSIGCDVPNSVQQIPGGIIFYDRRTNSVYAFTLRDGLVNIGFEVEDSIYSSIADPEDVFSSFDPKQLEYRLCVPLANTSTVRCWTYSIKASRSK